MKPADVPVRPLLVDTNVASQVILREGRWREFTTLMGRRSRFINFAVLGELTTFTCMPGVTLQNRTAMDAALEH
ncbi:MAG: hypothetical protein ACRDV8_02830, partial [Acidimicrobiales bacterium]